MNNAELKSCKLELLQLLAILTLLFIFTKAFGIDQ